MKNKLTTLCALSLLALSCQERTGISLMQSDSPLAENMLIFENESDFKTTVDVLSEMTVEDLKLFEQQKGYKSFYSVAESVYNSINFENLSEHEILDFVESNNEYICMTTDENGDRYIEPQMSGNIYSKIMNCDGIFVIGNNAFKVFERGTVTTDISKISSLIKLREIDIDKVQSDNVFKYTPNTNQVSTRSYNHEFADQRTTVGRERLRLTVGRFQFAYPNGPDLYEHNAVVRAYRRTLVGIWYRKERNITYHFDIMYYDPYKAVQNRYSIPVSSQENTSIVSKTFYSCWENIEGPVELEIIASRCSAQTPEIAPKYVTYILN